MHLVTTCFRAWQQLLTAQQHYKHHLLSSAFEAWQQQTHTGQLLQQRLDAWQQRQQQQQGERQQQQLRALLLGWRHVVLLTIRWRGEAPLLAAAYYQERLLQYAWAVWRGQTGQHHQHQQQFELQKQRLQDPGSVQAVQGTLTTAAVTPDATAVGATEEKMATAAPAPASEPCAVLEGQTASTSPAAAVAVSPRPAVAAAAAAATNMAAAEQQPASSSGSDVDAWRDWQLQQQQQQLQLLQLQAAQLHWRVCMSRKVLLSWFSLAAAGAATMAQQAQLKHQMQLELLHQLQQQQAVQLVVRKKYLERPFRAWQQGTALKRSAAAGFRCYNQLLKGFVGWRGVVLEQQQ